MLTDVDDLMLVARRRFLSSCGFPADSLSDDDVLSSPAWVRRGAEVLGFPDWRVTKFRIVSHPRRMFTLDLVRLGPTWEVIPACPLRDGDMVVGAAFRDPDDVHSEVVYLPMARVTCTSWMSRQGSGCSLSFQSHGPFGRSRL